MSAMQTYLEQISRHLAAGNATEHTHRPALQQLLQTLLPDYRITNEPRRIACGAPDFEIARGSEPIGHLEAKDVGVDLNKAQKSEQLQRYLPALNNLLLTDYLEFRWFVNGEARADLTVKLASLAKNGQLKIEADAARRLENLLRLFVETQIITLRSPEDLAKKMAHIAQQMKYSITLAYQQEEDDIRNKKTCFFTPAIDDGGKIHQQLNSFREVLIDTLSVAEFADMVAQTICYGLFAAKCSAITDTFSRENAVYFVPKTNPFLQKFFNQLAGIDLDERLVWMVEHLVAVLNRCDIAAILADFGKHTRREDPVVHFYETFLANYDAKLREVRGVYYTPEPVVSYIVRSVDLLLKQQFGLRDGLADSSKINDSTHKVQILDPATGTGTFLYAVIAQIYQRFASNQGLWSDYVSQHLLPRLHGFELLMAAYTVAHIKLSLQLKDYGYDFKSDERLRVFLTNTLDEAHGKQSTLMAQWLSDEANAASAVKRDSPVMVILGNPPYSYDSMNNEKWISGLIRDYYQVDGQSLNEKNPKGLQDDYVKFIRFAHWRIMQTGYGVLAFVTNHGYLDNPTFRGMRQALLRDFDEIYIVDLHGNSKKKETAPDGTVDKNVFDIQQGVAIGIFVKHNNAIVPTRQQPIVPTNQQPIVPTLQRGNSSSTAPAVRDAGASQAAFPRRSVGTIRHTHLYGTRASKYHWLAEHDCQTTDWTTLEPQAPFYLFVPQDTALLPEYEKFWQFKEVFLLSANGVKTNRDYLLIDFEKESLIKRIDELSNDAYPLSVIKDKYGLEDGKYWNTERERKKIQATNWIEKIVSYQYRQFDVRKMLYMPELIEIGRGGACKAVMPNMLNDNFCISVGRQGQAVGNSTWNLVMAGKNIADTNLFYRGGINCVPLYLYPTEKNDLFDVEPRKANFSPAFIADLENRLSLRFIHEGEGDFSSTISALNVFSYLYALLHSPTYRQRYAEFLKMDFPRLPLTSNKTLFQQLARLGKQLIELHNMDAELVGECCFPIQGDNVIEKIEYQNGKVYINKNQYFSPVSPEVWAFHIGGYQVCQKWLKDRRGRALNYDDCRAYFYIVAALAKTHELMAVCDAQIAGTANNDLW